MIVAVISAFAQIALGAAPSASAPSAAPFTQEPVVKSGADKMICKTLSQTGSLFHGPKECHSKREWDELNAASRDGLNDYQQRIHQINLSKPGG